MTAFPALDRQGVVTRFAPSPTGRLHLGHAASAIRAHDFARDRGGRFILRIEDIDPGRTREAFVDGILEDLAWLGLTWDGPVVRQSGRLPLYAEALQRLRKLDLVYPCFCTRADIVSALTATHGPEGAIYPGTCRPIYPDAAAERIAAGQPHAWRLDVAQAVARAGPLRWHDEGAGWVEADPLSHGDVVLARKDAPASYHLAVTVDDAAQGVTDVVRGEDLFAATHVHRLLQALLALPTPAWHHHPLTTDAEGRRLAKRTGAPALADLRAAGKDGPAVTQSIRAAIALGKPVDPATL